MDQRQLPEDFKDFINLLNSNDVCYLLVGGWEKDDLIKNKKASGRNRDLADVDNLLGEENE